MLRKAPLNPIEYGEGVISFDDQTPHAYSTCMRIHRGTKYQVPTRSGNRWHGWIEGHGKTSYKARNQRDAEHACIRHIERLIRKRGSDHAQRAS